MFQGTIEPEIRSIVQEQVKAWGGDEFWIGCSGNFTIERFLWREGMTLHSNDVSIYTSQLGKYLAGDPVDLTLREESQEELGWLEPYLRTDADRIATMMLGTRFLALVGKTTAYHQRMLDGYKRQFDRMHAETVAKLENLDMRVASYDAMDVREWLENVVPHDAPVISFPPFDVGGYETMWDPIDHHFTWDAPTYDVLDEDGIHATLAAIMDRPKWVLASNHRFEEWEDNLIGVVQTSNFRRPNYVYGSHRSTRIVKPRAKMKPVYAPRLGAGDRIGDTLTLAPIEAQEFEWLRSQYLNPMIGTAAPTVAVAVLAEGRIIGCLAGRNSQFTPDEIYLLSDFAVPGSDYPRLSKLVAMAACSVEFQQLLQRTYSRRFRTVMTTAFTKRPVSMKYRGVLDLLKRSEAKDGNFAYELNYGGTAGRWTLTEAVAQWRKKGWDKIETTEEQK